MSSPGKRRENMRGSVTAELAVVLPAMTILLAVLLLGVSAGMLQLRLEEGASAGARAAARGETAAQVLAAVSRISGEGSSASVVNSAGFVTVTVQGRVGGALSGLLPWLQSAQASAKVEAPAAGPPMAVEDPSMLAGGGGTHGRR